jgi:hypothetical protein
MWARLALQFGLLWGERLVKEALVPLMARLVFALGALLQVGH